MAHRLARLVYRMLKYGQRYVDKGTEYYQQRYRNQQIQLLRKNTTDSDSRSRRPGLELITQRVSGEALRLGVDADRGWARQ